MFQALFQKISTMLQEKITDQTWSSTRFAFIFTVSISNISVFLSVLILTIKDGVIPDVPEGILWLYALANGISFTGKVAQKFKEQK